MSEVDKLIERADDLLRRGNLLFAECALAEEWEEVLSEAVRTLLTQSQQIEKITDEYKEAIEQAVLEERERCAKICDAWCNVDTSRMRLSRQNREIEASIVRSVNTIAAAIRNSAGEGS